MENKGKRFIKALYSLEAASLLRLAKRYYSYRVLSDVTGIPAPILARYIFGKTLPTPDRAHTILKRLMKLVDPRYILGQRLADTGGIVDTSIVLTDPLYLKATTFYFVEKLADQKITKIVVPEASGIPLATSLSLALEVPFIVARRKATMSLFRETLCSDIEPSFCIQKDSIGKRDNVLIVDDIVETGATLTSIKRLIELIGASLTKVVALVVIGEEWKNRAKIEDVETLIMIMRPTKRARMPSL